MFSPSFLLMRIADQNPKLLYRILKLFVNRESEKEKI